MKLLDTTEVKEEKDKKETERKERVKKLAEEEIVLAKKVNDARLSTEERIKELGDEFSAYSQNISELKRKLDSDIAEKKSEVEYLEARRADAMKPIDQLRKEVELKLWDVTAKKRDLEEQDANMARQERSLAERITALDDREVLIAEKEKQLTNREVSIEPKEFHLKETENALVKRQLAFQTEVTQTNIRLSRYAKEMEDARRTNENYKETLNKLSNELNRKDLAVQDKYRALEQAKKHLGVTP